MQRNVNYILIGLIFCILTVAMIAFIFWIGRFGIDDRRVKIYHVYTKDAISGIGANTPVKYKGISVGTIINVGFKKGDADTVQLDVAINKKIPVREGSELVVDSDGFVGMNYLNLKQNPNGKIIEDEDEATLILAKNTIAKLLENAQGMTNDIQDIVTNVKNMTDSKNIEDIRNMIASLDGTKQNVDKVLLSAHKLLKDLDMVLLRGDFNAQEILTPLINKAGHSLQNLDTVLEKGSLFLDRLERDPYETLLGKRN